MNRFGTCLLAACCLVTVVIPWPVPCRAADTTAAPAASPATQPPDTRAAPQAAGDDEARREEKFRRLVTNVTLTGHFTTDGDREAKPRQEEYVITGATKLGKGDAWALTSTIRYGTVDVTMPVPVQVKWAGETPVITLDKVAIPGLGTFSARVVLDEGRYAGVWSHDEVGGHLFGRITPIAKQPAAVQATPAPR
jgi:hypothetical protein